MAKDGPLTRLTKDAGAAASLDAGFQLRRRLCVCPQPRQCNSFSSASWNAKLRGGKSFGTTAPPTAALNTIFGHSVTQKTRGKWPSLSAMELCRPGPTRPPNSEGCADGLTFDEKLCPAPEV